MASAGHVVPLEPDTGEAVAQPGLTMRLLSPLTAMLSRGGVSSAIAKSAAWSVGGNVAGAAASFVTQVILARSLEETRYGVYSYLLAWVNVALLVGKLEFDTAAVRFIGAYSGQGQTGLLRGFLRYGWRVVGTSATALAITAALATWALRRHIPEGTGGAVWAACALMLLTALLLFSGSALQGFRRVPQAQLPSMVLRPVLFGLGILLAASGFGLDIGAGGAVAVNAGATAIALAVSLFLLDRAVPANLGTTAPVFETTRWTRAVRGFLVIAAAQLILSQHADILVVGTVLGPRDAGLYSAASQLAALIAFASTAVIFVVLPIVSDLHARGRRAELQRLVVRTVQGCALVSLPIAVLLWAAGTTVLGWYGPAFEGAYPIMATLGAANVFHATIGIISGFLLTMTGHEWEASRVIVGTAVLNLVLAFALTPVLGAMGAALATVVAGLTKLALLWWYAWRYLGVRVLPYLPSNIPQAGGGA